MSPKKIFSRRTSVIFFLTIQEYESPWGISKRLHMHYGSLNSINEDDSFPRYDFSQVNDKYTLYLNTWIKHVLWHPLEPSDVLRAEWEGDGFRAVLSDIAVVYFNDFSLLSQPSDEDLNSFKSCLRVCGFSTLCVIINVGFWQFLCRISDI